MLDSSANKKAQRGEKNGRKYVGACAYPTPCLSRRYKPWAVWRLNLGQLETDHDI